MRLYSVGAFRFLAVTCLAVGCSGRDDTAAETGVGDTEPVDTDDTDPVDTDDTDTIDTDPVDTDPVDTDDTDTASTWSVTFDVVGEGDLTVDGFDCAAPCTIAGAGNVAVSAEAAFGSGLVGWTGDCVETADSFVWAPAAGSELTCTATFAPLPEGDLFAKIAATKEVIREPGVGAPAGDSDTVLSFTASSGVTSWRWVVRDANSGVTMTSSFEATPTFSCAEGGRGAYDVDLTVSDGATVATFRERRLVTCTLPRVPDGRPVVDVDLADGSYFNEGKVGGVVVAPGTLVRLHGDISSTWVMNNFVGTEEAPIHFLNVGLVRNTDVTKLWHLVSVQHVIIDGLGEDAHDYGFELSSTVPNTETALFVRAFTSTNNPMLGLTDIEIFGVKTGPASGSGIEVNTHGYAEYQRSNWSADDVRIHHTLVEDMGHEGFYIGYTRDWIGSAETHYAYQLHDAKIYRNRIVRTGWDCLQVSNCSEGLEVHDNYAAECGLLGVSGQTSSFQWNSGSSGHVYGNTFLGGSGSNLQSGCTGGDATLYSNVWRPAPADGGYALYYQAGIAAGTDLRLFGNTFFTEGGHLLGVNLTSPGCNEGGTPVVDRVQIENNAIVFPAAVDNGAPLVLRMASGTRGAGWTDAPNLATIDPATAGWCFADEAQSDVAPTCSTSPLLDPTGADWTTSGIALQDLPGGAYVDHDHRVIAAPVRYGAVQVQRR